MTKSALKVAIAGLGTVGGGTVQLLHDQAALLAARSGRELKLVGAAALEKPADLPLDGVPFFTDARVMARDADYDVLVELIGGAGGIALEIVKTALGRGKNVVTANKAMIAHHGVELATLAEDNGAVIGFEASVGGGIPIIKSLREGLAGNRVATVMGILNGTCNYILTTMREQGRDFADVLAEAQKLGYAEADPSFDIDGIDTAHKLAILASLAFGMPVDIKGVPAEGIRHVSALDIAYADELGYRIKLLGVARRTEAGVESRVYPAMVPLSFPLAHVNGVFNAVVTEGDFVGRTVLEGRGAGARPTASAVVADLMDMASGRTCPTFGVPVTALKALPEAPAGAHRSAYYIRLMVRDEPGVFADIAGVLKQHRVSMEKIIQRGRSSDADVPVVMTIHETDEASMMAAMKDIGALASVAESHIIRIESR